MAEKKGTRIVSDRSVFGRAEDLSEKDGGVTVVVAGREYSISQWVRRFSPPALLGLWEVLKELFEASGLGDGGRIEAEKAEGTKSFSTRKGG